MDSLLKRIANHPQIKKHLLRNLLLFAVLFLFLLLLPQIFLTIESISLLLTLFSPEPVVFGPEIIREIHLYDQDTRFFIFRPQKEEKKYPGIIFSLGIHPLGAEEPNLQKLFDTLVKNDFVVLAIDSRNLKEALIAPEEVQNLVDSFKFLAEHPSVKSEQIGFVGFSVGSSLAFMAAANPSISHNVKYLLWAGGYYSVKELIIETLSKDFLYQGELKSWEPSERIKDVVRKNLIFFVEKEESPETKELVAKILETKDSQELLKLFDELPPKTLTIMDSVSPKTVATKVSAPLFIIHGTKDTYIPFVHSTQLSTDFPGYKHFVLSSRYGHEAPQKLLWLEIFSLEFWRVIFLTNELVSRLR